jgi:hypothetical protein
VLTWLASRRTASTGDHGSDGSAGRPRATSGIRNPDDDRGGLGRWLTANNTFRTVGAADGRGDSPTASRRLRGPHADATTGHARAAHRLRRRARRLVRPLARGNGDPRGRLRRLDRASNATRARPRPARGALAAAAVWCHPKPSPTSHWRAARAARHRGRRHRRVDRLRRPPALGACPATSGSTTSGLPDLGGRAAARLRSSAIRCSAPGSGRPNRPRPISVKLCVRVPPTGPQPLVTPAGRWTLAYPRERSTRPLRHRWSTGTRSRWRVLLDACRLRVGRPATPCASSGAGRADLADTVAASGPGVDSGADRGR